MSYSHSIRLFSALVAGALALVACGGDDSSTAIQTAAATSSDTIVNRGAAGADDTSCPEGNSTTIYGHVINGLPWDMTLWAPRLGWKCDDWSGVSTPGRAFNAKTLRPGERYEFRLEIRDRRDGGFTLRADGIGYERVDEVTIAGESPVTTGSGGSWGLRPRSGTTKESWRGTGWCYFVPIATAPSSWRDTPVNEVFDAFWGIDSTRATMLSVDKGRVGLLFPSFSSRLLRKQDLCGSAPSAT
jgi:hypothetical protein